MSGKDKAQAQLPPGDETESDVEEVIPDSENEEEQAEAGEAGASSGKRKQPEFKPTHEIHGLKNATQHNGRKVEQTKYDTTKKSWLAKFSDGSTVLVKEENLKPIQAAQDTPVLTLNPGGKDLFSQISGIARSKGGNNANASSALVAFSGKAVSSMKAGSSVVESFFQNAAKSTVTQVRAKGPALMQGASNGVSAGCSTFVSMVCASLAAGARNSTYGSPQIEDSCAATAVPAGAAAGGGGRAGGFGSQPPPQQARASGMTYAECSKLVQDHQYKFALHAQVDPDEDVTPEMIKETSGPIDALWAIKNNGVPGRDDSFEIVVYTPTNRGKDGLVECVTFQEPGKERCMFGPNCEDPASCRFHHQVCRSTTPCGRQTKHGKPLGDGFCPRFWGHAMECRKAGCRETPWQFNMHNPLPGVPYYCQKCLHEWVTKQMQTNGDWGPDHAGFQCLLNKTSGKGKELMLSCAKGPAFKKGRTKAAWIETIHDNAK